MPKNPKRPRDINQLAAMLVGLAVGDTQDVLEQSEKNPKKIESGRKGGLVGGKARVAKLTPEQLTASAKRAAAGRWKKN